MKLIVIPFFILLVSLQVSAQLDKNFKLPKTWTKDFVISLSFTGSMDGSRSDLTFTYDSCKYVRNSGMHAPKKSAYLLSENDRITILKKMQELKVDKIHSKMSLSPVYDGWSMLLCFGGHCIQSGPSVQMNEKDKNIFATAFAYLEGYAEQNSK